MYTTRANISHNSRKLKFLFTAKALIYFVDEAVRLGPTFVDRGNGCFCKDPYSYSIREAIFVKANLSYFLPNLND